MNSLLDGDAPTGQPIYIDPQPPSPAPQQPVYQSADVIPKKTAAQEVYLIHKRARISSLISIFSVILIASIAPLTRAKMGIFVAAGIAGVISMGLALLVWKDTQRMNYLQQTYGLIDKKVGQ